MLCCSPSGPLLGPFWAVFSLVHRQLRELKIQETGTAIPPQKPSPRSILGSPLWNCGNRSNLDPLGSKRWGKKRCSKIIPQLERVLEIISFILNTQFSPILRAFNLTFLFREELGKWKLIHENTHQRARRQGRGGYDKEISC